MYSTNHAKLVVFSQLLADEIALVFLDNTFCKIQDVFFLFNLDIVPIKGWCLFLFLWISPYLLDYHNQWNMSEGVLYYFWNESKDYYVPFSCLLKAKTSGCEHKPTLASMWEHIKFHLLMYCLTVQLRSQKAVPYSARCVIQELKAFLHYPSSTQDKLLLLYPAQSSCWEICWTYKISILFHFIFNEFYFINL